MRDVMQGDQTNPKFAMNNNNRPTMPLHHRSVRTNIVLQTQASLLTSRPQSARAPASTGRAALFCQFQHGGHRPVAGPVDLRGHDNRRTALVYTCAMSICPITALTAYCRSTKMSPRRFSDFILLQLALRKCVLNHSGEHRGADITTSITTLGTAPRHTAVLYCSFH